jgi:hypothetical protein
MIIWAAELKELEKLHEALKGQLPNLEKELGQLIKFDDPNVILLYSRRCLEVIITDLCEYELKRSRGTEPLKGIIDKLFKEQKVPPHIVTSMHGLNDLSTYGTHPKDFDPKQVKPVLNNLDIIIRWYLGYKGLGEEITAQTIEEPTHEIKTSTNGVKRTLIQKNKKSIIRLGIILLVIMESYTLLIFLVVAIWQKVWKNPLRFYLLLTTARMILPLTSWMGSWRKYLQICKQLRISGLFPALPLNDTENKPNPFLKLLRSWG